jgi:hypothetical protein
MHEGNALRLFNGSQHKHWVLYEGANADESKRVAIAPDDSEGSTLEQTLNLISDGQYTLFSVSKKGASGNECRISFTKGVVKTATDSAQQSYSVEVVKLQLELKHQMELVKKDREMDKLNVEIDKLKADLKNAKSEAPKEDALTRIAGLFETPLTRAFEKWAPVEAIAGIGMSDEEQRFGAAIDAIDKMFPDFKPIAVIEKVIAAMNSPEGGQLKDFIKEILNG